MTLLRRHAVQKPCRRILAVMQDGIESGKQDICDSTFSCVMCHPLPIWPANDVHKSHAHCMDSHVFMHALELDLVTCTEPAETVVTPQSNK